MGSFFVEQGAVMDRVVDLRGGRQLDIPAASLAVFNTLSIIILIPLYDRCLVPLLRSLGLRISHLQRIGGPGPPWLCTCACVCALVCEHVCVFQVRATARALWGAGYGVLGRMCDRAQKQVVLSWGALGNTIGICVQ